MDFDNYTVKARLVSGDHVELVFDFIGIGEDDLARLGSVEHKGIDDVSRWCNFFGYWFKARIVCRSRDNYLTNGTLVKTVLSHYFGCSILNYNREDLKKYGPLFECFRTNVNNVYCYSPRRYTGDVPYTLFEVGSDCYYAGLIRGVYDGGKTWQPKLSYPDFSVDVKCGDESCRKCPFFNSEYWENYGKDNGRVKCNVPDVRIDLFEELVEDEGDSVKEEGTENDA